MFPYQQYSLNILSIILLFLRFYLTFIHLCIPLTHTSVLGCDRIGSYCRWIYMLVVFWLHVSIFQDFMCFNLLWRMVFFLLLLSLWISYRYVLHFCFNDLWSFSGIIILFWVHCYYRSHLLLPVVHCYYLQSTVITCSPFLPPLTTLSFCYKS